MISYEIWIKGRPDPIELELENDDLFQAFQRWLEADVSFKAKGHCITHKDGARTAFNFSEIAGIKAIDAKDKPKKKVGFV